jgi:hypothetical protein
MAPGVPFAMPRDERGFALPQVRIGGAEAAWLKAHPPFSGFDARVSHTAWDALIRRLDRPLEYALAGWGVPAPAFPLALDPRAPGEAMPAGFVAARRSAGNPAAMLSTLMLFGAGIWLWLNGMRVLMAGLPRNAVLFAAWLPLLLLPWWGERMPRALARVQPQVAEIIGDMLADLDVTGRLVASSPADAQLAHGGERLTWRVGEGAYAPTLGDVPFTLPQPAPADADAALRALVAQAGAAAQALGAQRQADLLRQLEADKKAGRFDAGWLFLPTAAAALVDSADPPRARAARDFLEAWLTQPIDEPYPQQAAFATRMDLLRALAALPVAEIANSATSVVERAGQRGH